MRIVEPSLLDTLVVADSGVPEMRVLQIEEDTPDLQLIEQASKVVLDGGLIVYPTDTVYGIGSLLSCDPIERIRSVKGREEKPMSIAFSGLEQLLDFVSLSAEDEETIKGSCHDGMTYIVARDERIPADVVAGLDTVGVRLPDSNICRLLCKSVGPLVSTSANISGSPARGDFSEIDPSILEAVDLVIDAGKCKFGRASRIIDLTQKKILRD